jgi:lipopolysaccharide/colanic/teichoic acid biosynthesis glycosyltransferase
MDVGLASMALAALLPVGVLETPAAIVASKFHGPFYRQERMLPGAAPFTMLKFQTMPPHKGEEPRDISGTEHRDAPAWANRWLRRTGLDELPEFLQVLTNKMYLVAPRPIMPRHANRMREQAPELYDEFESLVEYTGMKGGIFGPSQLYRRGHEHEMGQAATRASLGIDLKFYGYDITPAKHLGMVTRTAAHLVQLDKTPPEQIVESFIGKLKDLPEMQPPPVPPPGPEDLGAPWRYPLA